MSETTRSESCLDIGFAIFDLEFFKSEFIDFHITDRLGQSITLEVPRERHEVTKTNFRPISQTGFNIIFNIIENISWDFIDYVINATGYERWHSGYIYLFHHLEGAYLQSFPDYIFILRSDQPSNMSSINSELREKRRRLQFLREMWNNIIKWRISWNMEYIGNKYLQTTGLLLSLKILKNVSGIINVKRSGNKTLT